MEMCEIGGLQPNVRRLHSAVRKMLDEEYATVYPCSNNGGKDGTVSQRRNTSKDRLPQK